MCIRCCQVETSSDRPYCVHCTFAVRAEVEDGLRGLAEYLGAWAAFDAWCAGRKPGAAAVKPDGQGATTARPRRTRGAARA